MPDDALLLDLEHAREVYIQKQKATNALFAGVKNATVALNKANRSLQEFSDQDALFDRERLSQAFEGLESARTVKEQALDALLPDLRSEANRLASVTGGIRDAINALQSEPVDVVRLDRGLTALRSGGQDGLLDELMPLLEAELEQAQKELGSVFGTALRSAMAETGIEVTGQPPRFEIGRFELDANFIERRATLYYGKMQVAWHLPLSIEAVVKAYLRESKSIEGRTEDGQTWIRQFYEAWERARQRRGTSGRRASIVDCYYELVLGRQSRTFRNDPSKRSFADYTRSQFVYDLVEFTQRKRLNYEGQYAAMHTATQSQSDSPSKSMWVVMGSRPHDGNYVSDIEFERE